MWPLRNALIFRLICCFFSITWFVPDEVYQKFLMTSQVQKQRPPQANQTLPLYFKTIDGGNFIQCASSVQNHTLLVLSKETRIYLSGAFAFQTLYGHVDVNGYLFAPKKYNSSNFFPISVPTGHLPASFSTRDDLSDKLNIEQIQSRLREFINDTSRVINFVQENYPVAILLIKMEKDIASKFINQQIPHNIFSPFGRNLGYKLYLANKSGENSRMTEGEIEILKNLEKRFRQVVNKIYHFLSTEGKCIVFIVGNKGVGKSTAARFLINSLNTGQKECRTFLLDSDVGQSEMNPAGCISLNEVKKPMIGSPFVSQNCTFPNSFFFGSNSPSLDFDFYIKLVAHLVEHFHTIAQEDATTPSVLIVNTVGWIEDLGYDLMLRMLATVKPSIIINLLMTDSFNFIMPENYKKIAVTIERPKSSPPSENVPTRLLPAQLRHCQVAAYFAQLFQQSERQFTHAIRLSELIPYRLRFCSTSVYFHPELRHVDDKFILCALNYAMVALCKIEDGFEKYFEKRQILDDSSLPSRLILRKEEADDLNLTLESGQIDDDSDILPVGRTSFPMLRCFGFGLIRAISPQRKLFYILTPVEQRVLPQIDVLAIGNGLNTPEILHELNVYEASPYLVELETGLQEHHKKFFSPLRNITAAKYGGPGAPKRRCQ